MDLIVVESPTKAKTLGKFLGSGYSVEATVGHIKDLPKSKLGVNLKDNFDPDYIVVVGKEKVIAKITSEAKKAEHVYIATDPDREGEAIASHVKEIIGKSKSSRIAFHEITKSAVEEALAHPRDIDENLVYAQSARRVLDRLVGYSLSPLLWKKVRRGLSAGRVQSVVVRLIVEKEREIEAFKSEEYWEIYATLKVQNTGADINQFSAQLTKIDGKKADIKDGANASKIVNDLENSKYSVSDVKKREVVKNPYPPYTTSTLSQSAARVFGWSSKKTMSIAQRLYEEGLITYHRTDSFNISDFALKASRGYISTKLGDKYLPDAPRKFKNKSKLAQEAHEAIRPTDPTLETIEAENDQVKLYQLIWKRFISSQMKAAVYDETVILIDAKTSQSALYTLRTSGQIMKFDGWKVLYSTTGQNMSEDDISKLPDVAKDDGLDLIKVDSSQKFTQPPGRFTEATLIKTLEALGIGRPSTYAPTISTIQTRGYVDKNEGKFSPTTIGIAVNDFLMAHFADIFDYAFTADMEGDLDHVAQGQKDWREMMKSFWTPFAKKIDSVTDKAERVKIETEKLGIQCPDCKEGELVVRTGRFGKFISCSRFPDCKHTEKYLDKTGTKCPDCKEGDVIVKKSKRGRKFFGCSRYPDCKWASWNKPKS